MVVTYANDSTTKAFSSISTSGLSTLRIPYCKEPVKQVISLLDDCEFARYAPGDDTGRMDRLYEQAAAVIGQIENTIK